MGALGREFLTAGLELFTRVFANRFEHHEARFAVRLLELLHEAFVHHGCHTVEQIQIEVGFGVAHSFRAFERASSYEHR